MDEATVALYERRGAAWAARRGVPLDDLGEQFRLAVGGGPVLDAGCGPGRYLDQLGWPVVGLDAADSVLAIARAQRGAPVVRADLEILPFGSGVFAGVFARHSYLHLPKDRAVPALAEAARVLRPGGRLLLTTMRGSYEGRARPGDDFPGRWYSCVEPDELRALLADAGFVRVRVQDGADRHHPSDLLANAVAPCTGAVNRRRARAPAGTGGGGRPGSH